MHEIRVNKFVMQLISGWFKDALLGLFDTLFSAFVVGPLVIVYWNSAWNLMDLYILPDFPICSAVVTAISGFCVGLLLCIFQDFFSSRLTPKIGRMYYVLTRLFTSIFGVVSVGACRGVWEILDHTVTDPDLVVLTTVVSILTLISLRCFRNVNSAPFYIGVDSSEGYFDTPTFYKQNKREIVAYILDCIYSVTVVGFFVVVVWQSSWVLQDIYLYPDDITRSLWASLRGGYMVVVFTFALQKPMQWTVARLPDAGCLILADIYHLVAFIGTVSVWRGLWGLLDLYLRDSPKLGNWCFHIISLTMLILLNCSNSVLSQGVSIDAEEPDGNCVVFPCHYLRHFFRKETNKEEHQIVLMSVNVDASNKTEETYTPLNLSEEKFEQI